MLRHFVLLFATALLSAQSLPDPHQVPVMDGDADLLGRLHRDRS